MGVFAIDPVTSPPVRPKVLVLLAAFNGAPWIADQIVSVLQQDAVDVELVIGNDCSTDETLVEIRRFAADPRVRVLEPPLPTGSAAQNFLWLIRSAPGDSCRFVAFSDQDDIWLPRKLARACEALVREGAAGYSCAVTAFWQNGRHAILRQSARVTRGDFLFEGAGQGCTFVLSRDFYDRIRGFFIENEAVTRHLRYHDWATFALSRVWRLRWVFDPMPMVRYRQHGGNDTGARFGLGAVVKRISLIKDGFYRRQLAAIARLCQRANRNDAVVSEWHRLLVETPGGLARKFRVARFCIRGGRRRLVDRAVLISAVLADWI